MKRIVMVVMFSMVVFVLGMADVKATVYTDNFDGYVDGTPLGESPLTDQKWQRRGDKTSFIVSNPTGSAGKVDLLGEPTASWWKANAPDAGTTYQSVSVEFTMDNVSGYSGTIGLTLNQDWANSGYWTNENGYILNIRGVKDMWIYRVDGFTEPGIPSTAVAVWGDATPGQSYYSAFSSELVAGTTYRATFEKDGANFTATVETLGGTILGQATYTETVAARSGGLAGVWGKVSPSYSVDNFSYTLVPEPATTGLLVLGGIGLLRRRKV